MSTLSYEELRQRQDYTRVYMFGSDEYIEMLVQYHNVIDACVSAAAYDRAEAILKMLEEDCLALEANPGYDDYTETLAARKKEYEPWQPFETGHSAIEPY